MGVPGNGNNLSHGTSPQVPSTGRTTNRDLRNIAFSDRGGSGATPPGTTPKTGKQAHKGEGIMLNMLES
ncbi:hypothetical protein Taro_002828 [Colocasia esculenta]|uniref:Uncharacterized protein n=1 Tax=Colocasia esculenta TaxID=4460 RepID=A0A843TJW6_COLES|nr:hypothetical protein [Colocasia esculenta]